MNTTTLNRPSTGRHQPAHIYRLTAPTNPTTPRVAREAVAALLVVTHHPHLVDVARILISDVVTNVVIHTTVPTLSVEARVMVDHAIISVRDDDPTGYPRPRQTCDTDTSGRGLFLVEQLSHRWGVTWTGGLTPTGKRVWFELRDPGGQP